MACAILAQALIEDGKHAGRHPLVRLRAARRIGRRLLALFQLADPGDDQRLTVAALTCFRASAVEADLRERALVVLGMYRWGLDFQTRREHAGERRFVG